MEENPEVARSHADDHYGRRRGGMMSIPMGGVPYGRGGVHGSVYPYSKPNRPAKL
jgi:hypothetical protein